MPYSAVTQPSPLPRRNAGTRFSTLAVHSTRVSPKLTKDRTFGMAGVAAFDAHLAQLVGGAATGADDGHAMGFHGEGRPARVGQRAGGGVPRRVC